MTLLGTEGFGLFEAKFRASRIGRNPRTGEQVPVSERRMVSYHPGKRIKEVIAGAERLESTLSV